jgi:acetyltransferase-like isoleucine patch superfamily enzyme
MIKNRKIKIDAQMQKEFGNEGVSKFEKYQALIVGKKGLLPFLKYEILTSLLADCRGAIGIALRKFFYPALLGSCGRNILLGSGIALRHPHKISLENNVLIDDGCLLDAKGSDNNGIIIGNNALISRYAVLSCKNGDIEIGEYANIGVFCNISSNSKIKIGKKVLIGPHCSLFATEHRFENRDIPIADQGWTSKGITVEDNVWIGAGVVVLDGVTIGRDSIIGAGAVVSEDIPEFSIAVGMPAKVIRKR